MVWTCPRVPIPKDAPDLSFCLSLSLSLSSLCPFSLAHCNRLMFSHLRPIGALGADSSFLSFLVREGRPWYCDAEDIILIWLQQKATARRRWLGDVPLATVAGAVYTLRASSAGQPHRVVAGRQGRQVGRAVKADELGGAACAR